MPQDDDLPENMNFLDGKTLPAESLPKWATEYLKGVTVHEQETGHKCPPQYTLFAKLTRGQIIDGYRDLKNQHLEMRRKLYQANNEIGALRKRVRELAHIEKTMKLLERLQGKKPS